MEAKTNIEPESLASSANVCSTLDHNNIGFSCYHSVSVTLKQHNKGENSPISARCI